MIRSVRGRLVFLFVGVTGFLLTIFCGSLYLWVRRALERDLDQRVALHLGLFRERVAEEIPRVAALPAGSGAVDRSWVPGNSVAVIARPDGAVLTSSPGFRLPVDRERFRVEREGAVYRGRTARIRTRQGDWVVAVAAGEQEMRRELREILLYFLVFVPVVLLLSGIVGFFFVGKALTPVDEIRRQAERISRSNLAERLPVPGMRGEFQDLTRTFNEMLERLERAFEDLQSFAADVAHELRTPLANLRAELETALQQPGRAADPLLGSFAEEIDRMTRIVSDLLTLARLDLRQYALKKEPLDLGALLEEVREIWELPAAEHRITLLRGGDLPTARVEGDPVALRRVLMNLVENAILYNQPGGTVTLSMRRRDGQISVEVADTGPGMAPEHLPRLFHRFYRVDKARSRSTGGSGLGLAICKSFVEAHEGTIEVRSRVGSGTTFTVTLPLAP